MINDRGTIYYGTSIEHLEDIDKNGLSKPRHRQEQYISVSVSGYESPIEILHNDLKEMAKVFSEHAKICELKDNRMHFKPGYINTLTHVQGFGPNRNKYLLGFYGLVDNERAQDTIVAVIGKENQHILVHPDKENQFEYMSLALHGFVEQIKPDHILGWIVPNKHYETIVSKMKEGILSKRSIWTEDYFEKLSFKEEKPYLYALYPSDIELYASEIAKKDYHHQTKLKHLKHILSEVYPISHDANLNCLENEIKAWLMENKDKLIWDEASYRYIYRKGDLQA